MERPIIWAGLLEWHEKQKGPPEGQKIPRQVPCQVSANVVNGEPEVKGDGWPPKLIMQLIPKAIVGSLGGGYFRDVKAVLFMLQQCDALASLTRVMDSGYAGCVHFVGSSMHGSCEIKVLILLYSRERHAYLGFIPIDQAGFVDRFRKVIQQEKTHQAMLRQQGNVPNTPSMHLGHQGSGQGGPLGMGGPSDMGQMGLAGAAMPLGGPMMSGPSINQMGVPGSYPPGGPNMNQMGEPRASINTPQLGSGMQQCNTQQTLQQEQEAEANSLINEMMALSFT